MFLSEVIKINYDPRDVLFSMSAMEKQAIIEQFKRVKEMEIKNMGIVPNKTFEFNTEFTEVYPSGVDCDHPIKIVEKDNKKYILYEVIGLSARDIKVEKEFVNKTKTTALNITGNMELKDLEFENEINAKIYIDTDIYEKYDYSIVNGILVVTLYEKINEAPEFELVV